MRIANRESVYDLCETCSKNVAETIDDLILMAEIEKMDITEVEMAIKKYCDEHYKNGCPKECLLYDVDNDDFCDQGYGKPEREKQVRKNYMHLCKNGAI